MLPTDPGDRNRTSPFAFTGNRFEFRAPGSLQSIAGPMVTINTILAEALDYIATELETAVADGTDFNAAVQKVLEEIITDHGAVVFNGDGYSEDWQIEAAARGLPNLQTTLDALPELITAGGDGAVRALRRVQPPRDAQPLRDRARAVRAERRRRGPLDAGDRHDRDPARGACATRPSWPPNVATLKAAGIEPDTTLLETVSDADLGADRPRWRRSRTALAAHGGDSAAEEAAHAQSLLPAMAAVRAAADTLEGVVADDLWPLPTYQEMLYIL